MRFKIFWGSPGLARTTCTWGAAPGGWATIQVARVRAFFAALPVRQMLLSGPSWILAAGQKIHQGKGADLQRKQPVNAVVANQAADIGFLIIFLELGIKVMVGVAEGSLIRDFEGHPALGRDFDGRNFAAVGQRLEDGRCGPQQFPPGQNFVHGGALFQEGLGEALGPGFVFFGKAAGGGPHHYQAFFIDSGHRGFVGEVRGYQGQMPVAVRWGADLQDAPPGRAVPILGDQGAAALHPAARGRKEGAGGGGGSRCQIEYQPER